MKPSTFSQPKTPAVDQSTEAEALYQRAKAAEIAVVNYHAKQNKLHTQLQMLRLARGYIEQGDAPGLCGALILARQDMQEHKPYQRQFEVRAEYDYLLGWVRSMLGNYAWLSDWLQARGYKVYTEDGTFPLEVTRALRLTRLHWIDWMIEETKRAK